MNVQIHIRRNQNNKDVDGKGGQVYEQGYEYINFTVTQVSIEFVEKEERKQKGGYEYRTEHKTRSARKKGRKTGREERGARRRGATRRCCRAPSGQVHMRGTNNWD